MTAPKLCGECGKELEKPDDCQWVDGKPYCEDCPQPMVSVPGCPKCGAEAQGTNAEMTPQYACGYGYPFIDRGVCPMTRTPRQEELLAEQVAIHVADCREVKGRDYCGYECHRCGLCNKMSHGRHKARPCICSNPANLERPTVMDIINSKPGGMTAEQFRSLHLGQFPAKAGPDPDDKCSSCERWLGFPAAKDVCSSPDMHPMACHICGSTPFHVTSSALFCSAGCGKPLTDREAVIWKMAYDLMCAAGCYITCRDVMGIKSDYEECRANLRRLIDEAHDKIGNTWSGKVPVEDPRLTYAINALEEVMSHDKGMTEPDWVAWCNEHLPFMQRQGRLGYVHGFS